VQAFVQPGSGFPNRCRRDRFGRQPWRRNARSSAIHPTSIKMGI
jgi:hypothetical protein